MTGETLTRRRLLQLTGAAAAGTLTGRLPGSVAGRQTRTGAGVVVGQSTAEATGQQVLEQGGNVVDAIVAAALVSAVAAPSMTGVGGYGMSAVLAVDGGRRIVAIDGNSAAPQAMPTDIFQPGPDGKVAGRINESGWLAAGVPGILAGLQLALDQFGTRKFGELVQPAIVLARDGIPWTQGLAQPVRAPHFRTDDGSRKLFFPDGQPLMVGQPFRNPDLADMLQTLATANTVEAFYRGDIAQRIADGFQKNGGLVTAADMARYQARIVSPLTLAWDGQVIHTSPLTAGGLSVLQMLRILQALDWDRMPAGLSKIHARIEAVQAAWQDRLTWLGDPEFSEIPAERLLSPEYAQATADDIRVAVREGRRRNPETRSADHGGTIHLSAADRDGNMAALTLTHGNGFGAGVTVDGLGLTLGHGMSRFDPRPGHPNGPAPGKRPLHNMVPTIVTRNGQARLAIGGVGGRKIPNALFDVLTRFIVQQKSLDVAMAAPRLHSEGNAALVLEQSWPKADREGLQTLGFEVTTGGSARMNAVLCDQGVFEVAAR